MRTTVSPTQKQGDARGFATSLHDCLAFHVRDWSLEARDAWIYGIIVGWGSAIREVAGRHNWQDADVERLQRLHREFAQFDAPENYRQENYRQVTR